jgi:hypothetical protein
VGSEIAVGPAATVAGLAGTNTVTTIGVGSAFNAGAVPHAASMNINDNNKICFISLSPFYFKF